MYIDIYIVGLGPQLPGSFSLQDTKARARASFPETHLLMQKSHGSLKSGQNWIAKGRYQPSYQQRIKAPGFQGRPRPPNPKVASLWLTSTKCESLPLTSPMVP